MISVETAIAVLERYKIARDGGAADFDAGVRAGIMQAWEAIWYSLGTAEKLMLQAQLRAKRPDLLNWSV